MYASEIENVTKGEEEKKKKMRGNSLNDDDEPTQYYSHEYMAHKRRLPLLHLFFFSATPKVYIVSVFVRLLLH